MIIKDLPKKKQICVCKIPKRYLDNFYELCIKTCTIIMKVSHFKLTTYLTALNDNDQVKYAYHEYLLSSFT